MIINIKNKKDLITLDLRISQIRYVRHAFNDKIFFIDLHPNEASLFEFLFRNSRDLFLEFIKIIIRESIEIEINKENLKIIDN